MSRAMSRAQSCTCSHTRDVTSVFKREDILRFPNLFARMSTQLSVTSPFGSPLGGESDRRTRFGSDLLDLSDVDLQFTSSQPIFMSSQMDALFNSEAGASAAVQDRSLLLPPIHPVAQESFAPPPPALQDVANSGPPQLSRSSAALIPLPTFDGQLGRPLEMQRFSSPWSATSVSASKKQCRNCCYLFVDWPKDKDVTVRRITEIVENLCSLKESAYDKGISLSDSPTYFFNPSGTGVWVVLSAQATFLKKWDQIAGVIGSDYHQAVTKKMEDGQSRQGLDRVVEMFQLNSKQAAELYTNRLKCERLPTAKPRPRGKAFFTKDEDEDDARPAKKTKGRHSKGDGGDSSGKQQRFKMVRHSEREAISALQVLSSADPPLPAADEDSSRKDDQQEGLTLHEVCLRFVKSKNPIELVYDTIEKLRQCMLIGGEKTGYGAGLAAFFLDFEFLKVYHQYVALQTAVLDVLQLPPYSIPVQSLDPRGLVRHHDAWKALSKQNPSLYEQVITKLEYIMGQKSDFFQYSPFTLCDPVCNCFFLAVHVLGKPKSDRNPFLSLTLKHITQDIKQLYTVIKLMSDFLHDHALLQTLHANVRLVFLIEDRNETLDKLLLRKTPAYMHEFLEVSFSVSHKATRIARFQTLVSNMKANYWPGKEPYVSKAQDLYIMMQQSGAIFETMTSRHQLYSYVFEDHSSSDVWKQFFSLVQTFSTVS